MINAKKETEVWDAKRLVREYCHIAWMMKRPARLEDLSEMNRVRLRRIASAICAFLDVIDKDIDVVGLVQSVFDPIRNRRGLLNSPMTEEEINELMNRIAELPGCEAQAVQKDSFDDEDRRQLFQLALRYRVQSDKLQNTFSGMSECNRGGAMAIAFCKHLYNPHLDVCNDRLEEMLVLLLGSKFHGAFSVAELIEKYNYPRETDEELLDMFIDKF